MAPGEHAKPRDAALQEAHTLEFAALVVEDHVPPGQGIGAVALVGQYEPAVQLEQVLDALAPMTLLNVPAGHGVGAALPIPQ